MTQKSCRQKFDGIYICTRKGGAYNITSTALVHYSSNNWLNCLVGILIVCLDKETLVKNLIFISYPPIKCICCGIAFENRVA